MQKFEILCEDCGKDFREQFAYYFYHLQEKPALNPLDDLREATKRKHDKQGLTLAQLRAVAKRAGRVVEDIGRLRGTSLVKHSAALGWLPPRDLLRTRHDLEDSFQGLLRIADLGVQIGRKQRPQRAEILQHLYLRIFGRTGRFYDAEIAEIMSSLELKPDSQDALKQWRKAHGITKSAVSRTFHI